MKAMILHKLCTVGRDSSPLELADLPVTVPGENEILVRVSTCGVSVTPSWTKSRGEHHRHDYRLFQNIRLSEGWKRKGYKKQENYH